MNIHNLKALLTLIYWYPLGEIQQSDHVLRWAEELEKIAKCLRDQKEYRVNLRGFGFGDDIADRCVKSGSIR